jgi:hypothetical protein
LKLLAGKIKDLRGIIKNALKSKIALQIVD